MIFSLLVIGFIPGCYKSIDLFHTCHIFFPAVKKTLILFLLAIDFFTARHRFFPTGHRFFSHESKKHWFSSNWALTFFLLVIDFFPGCQKIIDFFPTGHRFFSWLSKKHWFYSHWSLIFFLLVKKSLIFLHRWFFS